MERKPRLYKLKDVLEVLDNDDSDFGDGDESDTESECDPEDIVAPVTDDHDENGDNSDAETIIYDNVDGPTDARQIPTDCVWQNKTFTPPDITFTGQPLSEPPAHELKSPYRLCFNGQRDCFMDYHCK